MNNSIFSLKLKVESKFIYEYYINIIFNILENNKIFFKHFENWKVGKDVLGLDRLMRQFERVVH